MGKIYFLFILSLLVVSSGCALSGARVIGDAPAPKVLEGKAFAQKDFGIAREGSVLKHSFVVLNDSDLTLNVKSINSSCGCTVSEMKKKTLLPGESSSLEVSFNTKGYSGDVRQFVYLYTDNPEKSIMQFVIKVRLI